MALWQPLPAGTTAWRKSYGRRNQAENVNSHLKGGFVNMERKFFQVTGLRRMMLLLGFSLAGVNRHIIKSFRDKYGSGTTTTARKTRRKRREATLNDLLTRGGTTSGSDPPAA